MPDNEASQFLAFAHTTPQRCYVSGVLVDRHPLDGNLIDEVRVYHRALSAAEVEASGSSRNPTTQGERGCLLGAK